MDSIAMLQRAVDDANAVVGSVRTDDLARSTPCTEWDLRTLVAHMVGVCEMFTTALSVDDAPPPSAAAEGSDRNPAAAFSEASRRLVDAWRTPGALERTIKLPFGETPAAVGVRIVMVDQLLHTWDLATALGRRHTMDPELAESALAMMQQMMRPEYRGSGKGFAEEVPCPEDAPVQDRLVAFAGRTP